jgi:hypothetical protein
MLKAISVLQPWASALLGPKDVENRSWPLPAEYLGVPLALHASKRYSADEAHWFTYVAGFARLPDEEIAKLLQESRQTLGAIIGVIRFEASLTQYVSPWFAGPYGWVKMDVKALATPIPCRGALSLWTVPADIEAEIRRQVGGMG